MAYDPSLGSKMGLVMALAPSVYVKFASTPLLVQFAKLFPGGQATSGVSVTAERSHREARVDCLPGSVWPNLYKVLATSNQCFIYLSIAERQGPRN